MILQEITANHSLLFTGSSIRNIGSQLVITERQPFICKLNTLHYITQMIQNLLTIFRCKAIMKPWIGPGSVVTVSVSLSPAKLPELAELFPLDWCSCDTGDSSSTIPMLEFDAGGADEGVAEDDYNMSNPTQWVQNIGIKYLTR